MEQYLNLWTCSIILMVTNAIMQLGPKLLSGLVGGVLMGIVLKQMEIFLNRADREQWSMVVLVVTISSVAIFQTAADFYSLWNVFVINYGA